MSRKTKTAVSIIWRQFLLAEYQLHKLLLEKAFGFIETPWR